MVRDLTHRPLAAVEELDHESDASGVHVESHGSLNAGLMAQSPPTQLGPGERAKLHRAASTLTDLRSRKDQLLVSELLLEAIERTALDATLLGEFLGQRKVANIDKLVEQARAIDRTSPGDLNGFITQLSEFVVSTPKEPLAATSAEGNVIRIMTIHNAKGLEFPVVVVPDLNRKNRSIDIRPEFDRELGPLVPNQGEGCVGFDLYAAREKEQEELKRLLYVACTRAADYLVLSSSINDLDKPTSEWLKFIGNRFDLRSGRCRADLPEGFAVPEVRVTDEEPRPERMPVGNTRGADLCKLIEKTHQLAKSGQGMVPDSVVAIPADTNARRRFSFSRLSGELAGKSLVTESADSYEAESRVGSPVLDSRGFGTLIHAVLERIKFGGEYDVAGLCEFLAPLHVEQHAEEASASACEMVSQFLASERAAEIAEASVVRREVEFVLPWLGTQGHFEGHYLHGFIDCLYQDAQGGWHLLDYKSNQLATAGVPAAAQQYAAQMFVYTLACERALGVEPVESVLHFLRPKAEFSFEWAGTDRSVMAAQLNESIHAELEPASD